jgi:hypothetical protein
MRRIRRGLKRHFRCRKVPADSTSKEIAAHGAHTPNVVFELADRILAPAEPKHTRHRLATMQPPLMYRPRAR